ncbi:MAG TPA: hypothetical protein VGI63_08905 [Verrucomicrobiae bacterium]|jgi:small-conductance mechanosensitive channel
MKFRFENFCRLGPLVLFLITFWPVWVGAQETASTNVSAASVATTNRLQHVRANPKTDDLIISFNKFADSALNIFVVHVWSGTDGKLHFAEMQELNLKIKGRFDAEKIEFAFPTQTVYVKTDTGK